MVDLITTVEKVELVENGDHIVDVRIDDDTVLPQFVQELRARGRAMLAAGAIETVSSRASDIVEAVKNLSIQDINLNTDVEGVRTDQEGRTVITVRVN